MPLITVADNLATIPVFVRAILVEIALVWFEEGCPTQVGRSSSFSSGMTMSSSSRMTMGTLLLPNITAQPTRRHISLVMIGKRLSNGGGPVLIGAVEEVEVLMRPSTGGGQCSRLPT